MSKLYEVYIFTNGNVACFDNFMDQMPELNGHIRDREAMLRIAQIASLDTTFSISKFTEWVHPITEREFKLLAGLEPYNADKD